MTVSLFGDVCYSVMMGDNGMGVVSGKESVFLLKYINDLH